MSFPKPNLRVHINQIDYTLSPAGFLDDCSLPRVPVIRIYGATSLGKKACVHIHQVYPYFFVEYLGELNASDVNAYIRKLSHSLNHAMAISLKRNPLTSKSRFIRAVLIVKGIHFYGFHSSYSPFLKILMLDPALVSRAVTIMQSGTIMQTRFRVYESHISFILQFMCDFGLYGCGWIDVDEVWQRGNDVEDDRDEPSTPNFNTSLHYRESRMELELDVASHQILNRHRLSARNIHHKLEIPAAPFPPVPLVPSVRELWEDERAHRLAKSLNPSPDIPIDLSANSRGVGGGWAAEARWRDELRQRIENEETDSIKVEEDHKDWEDGVMTTFESVEALWESKWRTWKPVTRIGPDGIATNASGTFQVEDTFSMADVGEDMVAGLDIDVNENILTSQDMNQLVDLEDDWEKLFDNTGVIENDDGPDEEALENPDPDFNSPHGSQIQSSRDQSPALSDGTQVGTPNTPRKRQNPFQDAWLKLAGLQSPAAPTENVIDNSSDFGIGDSHTVPKPTSAVPSRSPSVIPINFQSYERAASGAHPHLFMDTENRGILGAAQKHLRPGLSRDTEIYSPFNTIDLNHDDPFLCSDNSLLLRSTNDNEERVIPETCMVQLQEFESTAIRDEERSSKRRRISHVPDPDHLTSSPASQPSARISIRSSATISPYSAIVPISKHTKQYVYATVPPTPSELEASLDHYDIPQKIYRDPYYSKESDAPERAREYSGLLYHLRGEGLGILEDWHVRDQTMKRMGLDVPARKLEPTHAGGWEYASCPPSVKETKRWLLSNGNGFPSKIKTNVQSQIEGPTQENIYGLNNSPVVPPDISRIKQDMTMLSLELFAPSRGNLVPDPNIDEITAVLYSFQASNTVDIDTSSRRAGKILVQNNQFDSRRLRDVSYELVSTELELINQVIDIVVELDPDVLIGWDIQNASWGYLNARASTYGFDISDLISRAPPRPLPSKGIDQWGIRKTSTFKVAGRHVLNVWRIMRKEQTLKSYTFENVAFHLLHRRMPRYSYSTLTKWFRSNTASHTARILQYLAERTSTVLEMIDRAEVITKSAELARVFGVDFFSVISRGSQFKVESVLFRIAKPESFVLISPSRQDVGRQNAAECMPLIMEPLSAFYKGPLLVLDFQSLYPSVMIAYNYCYSTCIGRISKFKGQFKFGVTPNLSQPPGLLSMLQDYITVAPNGIMYLQPTVRKGLLGRMLSELLDTRIMVKQAMKNLTGDKSRKRILDARQLGLKYICNVTYGYTTASFSGRMPAVEIADSIVQSGRETLEKAIRHINSTKKWGAKVVYGDTDSIFVYLPGRTKDQAFRIGQDIADSVTALNPAPIKLKFEKVYLPCILMAKKRYVGFKYDNPDDREPTFEAKGIETVRRDGVPAQHKMVEKCLTLLFRTQDLSRVKAYCWSSWKKILENKVSIQDFIFAKEVRLGTYSDNVPPPPGVMVAARRMLADQNDEPQYGERVPYVIVRGEGSSRLVDRSVDPRELLNNPHKRLDGAYYISRVLIPPLERIFNLVGADVRVWYDEMPKTFRADQPDPILLSPKKDSNNVNQPNIDDHFHSSKCLNCGSFTVDNICDDCHMRPQATLTGLLNRIGKWEKRLVGAHQICTTCTASAPGEPIECESLDCPWLFERKKMEFKVEAVNTLEDCIRELGGDSPSPSIWSDSE